MYAIHTTPGFIISSRPTGEAGKLLSVFTRDLGLIKASAQGIRFEKSKLRPFIQDHSLGEFSFVRGKEFWRLTNAQEMQGRSASVSMQSKELVARIAALLGRLLQGEDPHPELFATIGSFIGFFDAHADLDLESSKTLESLVVVRILHRLGYVPIIAGLELEIASDAIDPHLLDRLHDKRTELNMHINRALRESHL